MTARRPIDMEKEKAVANASPASAGSGASLESRDTERRKRIERTAYYLAQKRGFRDGAELEDWIEAERRENEPPSGRLEKKR